MTHTYFLCVACLLLFFYGSCNNINQDIQAAKLEELKLTAFQVNNSFAEIHRTTGLFAKYTELIFQEQSKLKDGLRKSKYGFYKNALYKEKDDGGSAAFYSTITKVGKKERTKIQFTEFLDLIYKPLLQVYPNIVQAYFNTHDSFNRIYPYFDVLSQYDLKIQIPTYNFYYLADKKHNPQKVPVWVNEPYVDPAGRGWMISSIAPVYQGDFLEGVVGLDITIFTITDQYINQPGKLLALLHQTGLIISIKEKTAALLDVPPLKEHQYLETIRSDTYHKDDYNIMQSKNRAVRKMAQAIFKQGKSVTKLELANQTYQVFSAPIKELNWYFIELAVQE